MALFVSLLSSLITAAATIAAVIVTQKSETKRKRMELGLDPDPALAEHTPAANTAHVQTPMGNPTRTSRRVGLLAMLFSLIHFGFLQFSRVGDAALTVGTAADIAETFGLFIMGVLLLLRR